MGEHGLRFVTGSIPAHTGKPQARRDSQQPHEVYPRTHGEAGIGISVSAPRWGLSPHTRGSPGVTTAMSGFFGSIPAHTGKPRSIPRCPS